MSKWLTSHKDLLLKSLIIATTVVIVICIIFGFISGSFSRFFNSFFEVIAPIIIGFVIAYLSNPLVTLLENRLFKRIGRFTLRRLISILLSFLFIIVIIAMIITMIIPSLISTVKSFWDAYIVNYVQTINDLANNINSIMDNFHILNNIDRLNAEDMVQWVKTTFPWIDDVVAGDFSSVFPETNASGFDISSILGFAMNFGSSVFSLLKNILLGLFIAGYMLMAKEKFCAYLRRFLNSILHPKKVRAIVRFGKLLDRTFGGFIEGQLLDAGVVGIICFVVFSIFKLPIPPLLSTIIATTNVIPIFGPFIGGIPAAFLVLLAEPEKTLLFIVLIFVIQQIDGNIICPHILGDRINISSLATIIAIITMGGLFGIFGMVIGVPVFAVVIHLINDYTMNSLRKKGLETSLNHYYVGNPEKIADIKNIKQNNKKGFATKLKNQNKNIKEK
jgi:predicted PurR-regulated permease PerM